MFGETHHKYFELSDNEFNINEVEGSIITDFLESNIVDVEFDSETCDNYIDLSEYTSPINNDIKSNLPNSTEDHKMLM